VTREDHDEEQQRRARRNGRELPVLGERSAGAGQVGAAAHGDEAAQELAQAFGRPDELLRGGDQSS